MKKKMTSTILVTGGAGFIGSQLILRLLEDGYKVVCVDNMNKYYDPVLKEARLDLFRDRIDFYKLDISDKEALEKVFASHKIDKVCHLAAQAGVRYSLENPYAYAQSNVVGTLNILEACHKHGINHIVHASTSSIYGLNKDMPFKEDQRVDSQVSLYAATKRSCELMAQTYNHLYGMDITCLRFFTVYGPWGRPDMALFKFTKNILEGKPIPVFNNGDMVRDFTYVGDIVQGFMLALKKPLGYCIINLGAGKPVTLMDYIRTIEKHLGRKAKIKFLPMQPGDVKETRADISKAKKLLGFTPKVHVDEGVKNFIDWYKEFHGGEK